MEESIIQEEYENRVKSIRKEREMYQEQLALKRKEEKKFETIFFNDMRELEAIKAENGDDIRLIDRTELCQNALQSMKSRIDDMLESLQKEITGKIKELDDKEGYLKYEMSQNKKLTEGKE